MEDIGHGSVYSPTLPVGNSILGGFALLQAAGPLSLVKY